MTRLGQWVVSDSEQVTSGPEHSMVSTTACRWFFAPWHGGPDWQLSGMYMTPQCTLLLTDQRQQPETNLCCLSLSCPVITAQPRQTVLEMRSLSQLYQLHRMCWKCKFSGPTLLQQKPWGGSHNAPGLPANLPLETEAYAS